MVIDMNEAQVRALEQVRQVLQGTQSLEFGRPRMTGSLRLDRVGAAAL